VGGHQLRREFALFLSRVLLVGPAAPLALRVSRAICLIPWQVSSITAAAGPSLALIVWASASSSRWSERGEISISCSKVCVLVDLYASEMVRRY